MSILSCSKHLMQKKKKNYLFGIDIRQFYIISVAKLTSQLLSIFDMYSIFWIR